MQDILIKNGLIVSATETLQADLLIVNGVIARIGAVGERPGAQVIDATGQYVMPGGVDAHTHLNLSVGGLKVSDGFFDGTAAAAYGGTTCVVEHPSFGPDDCTLMHQIQAYQVEAAGACVVDYGLHGVFQHLSADLLNELPALMNQGVSSAKIYLTYDGRLDDGQILSVLDRARSLNLLTAFHAENHAIINYLCQRFKAEGKRSPEYHPLSRPPFCEAEAIQRVIHLAEAAGGVPIYIVHLSTAVGLEVIEAAQGRGLPVSAEVCPQHLLLEDSCYLEPEHRGLQYIMAPPARKAPDTEALWQGLARGNIDVVATDHCSFRFADKLARGTDDFSRCPGGIPGVETRLPLMFSEGVLRDRISLNRFVDVVSTAPARFMGLFPRKGHLSPGADADVVVFNPKAERILTPKTLRQNADYSPFEGRRVYGWPSVTIVRGRIVAQEGRLMVEKGWGHYIHRQQAGGNRRSQGDRK